MVRVEDSDLEQKLVSESVGSCEALALPPEVVEVRVMSGYETHVARNYNIAAEKESCGRRSYPRREGLHTLYMYWSSMYPFLSGSWMKMGGTASRITRPIEGSAQPLSPWD